MEKTAEVIIKEARFARKRDWGTYEYFKQRLQNLNLSPVEYETYIHKLTKILGV